jgi:GWxTD domain-containing protein
LISKGLKILAAFAVITLFVACGQYYQRISERNFAHIYNPMLTDIHPVSRLLRVAADSSILYLRVPVNDITFPEFRRRDDQIAGIKIEYFVVDSVGAEMWRDSSSITFFKPQKPATTYMQFVLGVKHHPDSSRFLEYQLTDVLSGAQTNEVLRILPDSKSNIQRYASYFNDVSYPLIRHFTGLNDSVRAFYTGKADSLWLFHLTYNTNDSIPFDFYKKYAVSDFVYFNKPGSYIINSDSSFDGGLRYFVGEKEFPMIRHPEQMLYPIRMLVNSEEWQELNQFPPKRAVDTFWLVAAPDTEAARQLIQVFYNRVQLANIKFSNHREGWKTDMGKTMVLNGLPDEVEISDTGQSWYYFIEKNEKLQIPFLYDPSQDEHLIRRNDTLLNKFMLFHINGWRRGKY